MERLARKTEAPRGILHGPRQEYVNRGPVELQRFEPPRDLSPFIEHFWIVRWDLKGQPPRTQETLPHPSIHWATEGRRSEIFGIQRGRFTTVLRGAGRVVAAKFRPGGFCSFTPEPLHTLTGLRVPASKALGSRVRGLTAALRDRPDDDAVLLLCEALRSFSPKPHEDSEEARVIVEAIARDREMTSVARVCERFSMAPLALQRLFRRRIGVSPKWVIQRYRLHEALERIHAEWRQGREPTVGQAPSWAALAAELGFTDQAHFSRTFKTFIGVSPGQYARRLKGTGG